MKIIALSDIHGDIGSVRRVGPRLKTADIILLVGDLTQFQGKDAAARVVDAVANYNPRMLAVAGNCDQVEVDAYLAQRDINLHRKCRAIEEVAFLGIGGGLPFRTLNEFTDAEFDEFLRAASAEIPDTKPFILVSHQPPYGTVADRITSGAHVGSRAIRTFIEEAQPRLCFTGHIHEGCGKDRIGKTHIINPGPLSRGRYAYAEMLPSGEVGCLEIRAVE